MSDKKKTAQAVETFAAPVAVVYYEHTTWKGVREVCRCATCGTCRDDEDAMMEHVLLHFPVHEQPRILDEMLQRKQAPASVAPDDENKENV